MIIIIDRHRERVSTLKKALKSRYYCAVAQSAEHMNNLLRSRQPAAVIADLETLESFQSGWADLLILGQTNAQIVVLAEDCSQQLVEKLEARGIRVLDPRTQLKKVAAILLPLKGKGTAPADRQEEKSISRLRDHMFSNLLEGHDVPQDTTQVMEFLGLTSSTEKYYLSFVISFASKTPDGLLENVWETALKIQSIAREEISKIAINRSCIRTPDRVVFVLLMRQPGEPFRYELENVLEVVRRRIDRECGLKIAVGVGLAELTVNGITHSYHQACDALAQGKFFGSSFVCFHCDLFDYNTQRFQIQRSFKEQLLQHLYHEELEQIDHLLESQFHQFYTNGLATKDNIMALKLDLAVFLMDISDKLGLNTERPRFYSHLINDSLSADSLTSLEFVIKKYLREMAHTSHAEQDKRTGRVVRSAQALITEHISEPINVQILAQRMRISPNYLSAVFKSETGVRLSEYITNVKMQEAARQIRETQKNIAEISADLGYDGASYFSKLFKKQYGVNPSDYRASNSPDV